MIFAYHFAPVNLCTWVVYVNGLCDCATALVIPHSLLVGATVVGKVKGKVASGIYAPKSLAKVPPRNLASLTADNVFSLMAGNKFKTSARTV